jgi:GH15 family glucan-1,4-alpha-glucosidase
MTAPTPGTPRPQPLDLALIGNCRVSALVDGMARIVWWCFPRFDSDPVFSHLLANGEPKGFCDIVVTDLARCRSAYQRNTALVETEFEDNQGGKLRVIDFAPRFSRYERLFRPPQLVRRIVPVAGLPRIAIRVRPTHDFGRKVTNWSLGSNHIRYESNGPAVRLTTDAPLSYVSEETSFPLTKPLTLILGPDEPFPGAVDSTAREFEELTREYWQGWVRALAIPFEWQEAVIRAAITLMLCSFEETGGIVAAATTSVSEAPGSARNWDYRYCWLRDAHFVVQALNRLGATETMEAYLNYVMAVAADGKAPLRPLHSIALGEPEEERLATELAGYLGNGPVRVGNAASVQTQNDVYGSVILAATQMFLDERLPHRGDEALFRRLEPLGDHAFEHALTPDAGIWEYRGRTQIHTHSAALCWAACDRLGRIAGQLGLDGRARSWLERAETLREPILAQAWNEGRQALAGTLGGGELDASTLLLAELGMLAPGDPRFVASCAAIGRELSHDGWIMRYSSADDFGRPEVAFLACSFWYIDALAATGRQQEARDLFARILAHRNAYGLLSEDIDPKTGQLWGNFPQTYSMAGIVNSAMRLSRRWEDVWCQTI